MVDIHSKTAESKLLDSDILKFKKSQTINV